MTNFRVWAEKTRNGGYLVRHVNPDGKREKDYRLEPGESVEIDGKRVVGKNLANLLCEKVRQKYYAKELGSVAADEAIAPLIDKYIAERESNNYQPSTLEHNRHSLRRLVDDNHIRSIAEINNEQLRDWKINMTQRGLANETIRGTLADTSTFLNWLVETGKLASSPFGKKMLPEKKDAEPKYYTAAEFLALDAELAVRHYPTRILCRLAHSAALRKEEALGVTWEDITWDSNGEANLLVRKEIAKGKKRSGVVPLNAGMMEVLGSRKSGRLVQATKNHVDHYFKMAREALLRRDPPAMRRELTIHGLRHTFAKNHLQSGKGNLNSLMKLMRHSTLSSVMIYAQFERTFFREAINETYRQQVLAENLAGQKTTTLKLRGTGGAKKAKSLDRLKPNDTNGDMHNNEKGGDNSRNSAIL